MPTTHKHKKNLIVSYKNLTSELKELFKEAYPDGHTDFITKFVKPNGEAIYVVPFETEDTAYMVKFDMKVDTLGEDLDKALFDDDGDGDGKEEEFAPLSEAIDKEDENISHNEKHLRHGDFADALSHEEKQAVNLDIDKEGLKEMFNDEDDLEDLDDDGYGRSEGEEESEDIEPSDDDLRGIESEFGEAGMAALEDVEVKAEEPAPKKGSTSKKAAKPKAQSAKATPAKKKAGKAKRSKQ